MDDIDAEITLSKLDVAKRQLETAVEMWFDERDAVSTHTLAAAAHRVVHDVAAHRGSTGAFLLDGAHLANLGFDPKAFKRALRQAETFFKHAENDPNELYNFSAGHTEYILASAIECFNRLVSERSATLAMFEGWLHFRHPETLTEATQNYFADLIPQINQLTRRQFKAELGKLDFVRLLQPKAG